MSTHSSAVVLEAKSLPPRLNFARIIGREHGFHRTGGVPVVAHRSESHEPSVAHPRSPRFGTVPKVEVPRRDSMRPRNLAQECNNENQGPQRTHALEPGGSNLAGVVATTSPPPPLYHVLRGTRRPPGDRGGGTRAVIIRPLVTDANPFFSSL